MIGGGKLLLVLRGLLAQLGLRGHRRDALLANGSHFRGDRFTGDATGTVITGAIAGVDVDGRVVDGDVGDGAVVDLHVADVCDVIYGPAVIEAVAIPEPA